MTMAFILMVFLLGILVGMSITVVWTIYCFPSIVACFLAGLKAEPNE